MILIINLVNAALFTKDKVIFKNFFNITYYFHLISIWVFVLVLSPIYCNKLIVWSKQELENFYFEEFKDDLDNQEFISIMVNNSWVLVYSAVIDFYKNNFKILIIIDLFLAKLKFVTQRLIFSLYPIVYKFYTYTKKNFILFSRVFFNIKKITLDIFFIRATLAHSYSWQSILSVFYHSVKSFILPLFISIFLLIIIIDYYNINFIRQLAAWAIVGLIFFWLMSGFNFFLKRYRFGKFTSAIQRFWKRTNTYFWMIEGFLFCLFFYYYINSSQEVYYFFDESNLNQNFLTSLISFYSTSIVLIFLIMYSIYLMLNLANLTYKQQIMHIKIITILMVYIFLLECYQFYYVITLFSELTWDFDNASNLWTVNWRSPKVRVKTQYIILALIAKYWHFLFIFFSWLFLVLKSFEQKRIHYTLFGVNLQNCILLFILNILFNINWLRWIFRRFYDTTYYWFFLDFNNWGSETIINEFFLFFCTF